ncbi:hypothetical protein PG993_004321 [Apiospora rasikravindrae]|uniref:Uncharacterized protein n=1 Tax=Apiospora rasikravindrae TaxID=990691 RepID=A0ABR1TCG9_9PEZI
MCAVLPQPKRRSLGPSNHFAKSHHQPDHVVHDALHALDEPNLLAPRTDSHATHGAVPRPPDRQAVREPRRPLDQVVRARLESGRAPLHAPPEVGEHLGLRGSEMRQGGRAQGRVGGRDPVDEAGNAPEPLGLRHVKGVQLRLCGWHAAV